MTAGEKQAGERAAMVAMPAPAAATSPVGLNGPPIPPVARVRHYSPDEWEEFIREWASAVEQDYAQIKRFGGAGDKGVDIAGFKTDQLFDGPWDCFQAKHYDKELNFAVGTAEMLKVFHFVETGAYTLPDTYQFLAPKGLSTRFNMLISKPTALREEFLDWLAKDNSPAKALDAQTIEAVRERATATDFSMFKSVEILDALTTHSRTRWHAARFGAPLPDRDPAPFPPEQHTSNETPYLRKLLAVYTERHPDKITTLESAAADPQLGKHLQRQRVRFYRAEALKQYSVGAVPPGTFEKLQEDIHDGVIDIFDDDHPIGWTRLTRVLTKVGELDLNRHRLIEMTDMDDRKGVCHQLANDGHLTWVEDA